jgi:universal stress protein A
MSIQKIACCTDFSENAEGAFLTALEMAERYEATLTVLHVLPPVVNPMLVDTEWVLPVESRKSMILELEKRMQEEYGTRIGASVDSELLVLEGHVSSEIMRHLEENQVDVVVTGAYGLSGVGLVVFGSIAKSLAQKAPCSVLIVRLPGASKEAS